MERRAERSAWRIAAGAERPAAEPQTEARRVCGVGRMHARDERVVCGAQRAWSRGRQGRPSARGAKHAARWSRRVGNFRGVPTLNIRSENTRPLSSGSRRTSIYRAGCRAFRTRGYDGRGIDARPAAKLGMGLWAVVAGAFARRKPPSSEGVADRLFVGGNAGSAKASPGPVRNPDVWIRGRIIVGPHLGQSPRVNTSPVTDFPMRFLAVVWRPTVGVEFPGFESADDDLLPDGDAGVKQAAVRPRGKPV